MTRILISTGETSGEVHASKLIGALRERLGEVTVEAVGGKTMASAGATVIEPIENLSVMGLVEGTKTIPAHVRLLQRLRHRLAEGRYDLAILIDYPGLHLKVAAAASACGVPVLYYIAPQLWAWGAWRIRALRKHVECLAVVLPFEEAFFRDKGLNAKFVGHPLLDHSPHPSAEDARGRIGLAPSDTVLALLPGSRKSEIERLWPAFRDAAALLRHSIPQLRVVVGAISGCQYDGANGIEATFGDSRTALVAADAALCKSGTVTLEAALADTPMVIAYRVHALTYAVARLAVRVRNVGLVNLVAGDQVSPELLQSAVTPENLANTAGPLLNVDSPEHQRQLFAFKEVRGQLGSPGAANRVAALAQRFVA